MFVWEIVLEKGFYALVSFSPLANAMFMMFIPKKNYPLFGIIPIKPVVN